MNQIFLFLITVSCIAGAYFDRMEAVTKASFDAAKGAVELAIGLVGAMALWLGIIKVAEEAGLLNVISRAIYPLLKRLFPDIPEGHPALSSIVMNIAANMLGLGNAATPIGIKAMKELDELNPRKGAATDAMCLFLAINTSNVTLLPLGVIALRASAGAAEPASIIIPTLLATATSTITAIIVSLLMRKLYSEAAIASAHYNRAYGISSPENIVPSYKATEVIPPSNHIRHYRIIMLLFWLSLNLIIGAKLITPPFYINIDALKDILTHWLIPCLMAGIMLYGASRGVKVYEAACEGAKEGFNVAIRIIPFLVMILCGVAMFRASGAFDALSALISPVTALIGFPIEVLPVALVRPLSGSGAFGLVAEIINNSPDSFNAFLASCLQGSTETTFYVLAVYFGAIGIKNYRYALVPALCADVMGALSALFICRIMY